RWHGRIESKFTRSRSEHRSRAENASDGPVASITEKKKPYQDEQKQPKVSSRSEGQDRPSQTAGNADRARPDRRGVDGGFSIGGAVAAAMFMNLCFSVPVHAEPLPMLLKAAPNSRSVAASSVSPRLD